MQKIVVDTNVLVSYCISNLGYSFQIFEHIILKRKVDLLVSEEIIEEYNIVLARTRFANKYPEFKRNAESLLIDLSLLATFVYPHERVYVIKALSDNKFLEACLAGNADFFITGNSNDFDIGSFHNTKIVSPKTYWELFG